jgi:protein SCO1/2
VNRRSFLTNYGSSQPCSASATRGPAFYTNAVLRTHEGKRVKFYDDLIKDKHVVINFMYADCQGSCPASTANLVRVHERLKSRIGRDIFMYSMTVKPEHDTPAVLKEYAKMHGVKDGWLFLTGRPDELRAIWSRLGYRHPALDQNATAHTRMVRVINDRLNRWIMCSSLASVETIVQVIRWGDPIKPLDVRRRENLIEQARIDKITKAGGTLPTWLDMLREES